MEGRLHQNGSLSAQEKVAHDPSPLVRVPAPRAAQRLQQVASMLPPDGGERARASSNSRATIRLRKGSRSPKTASRVNVPAHWA